jgi:hypothetical protein
MVGLENELIDSYVNGELPEPQRQQFEQAYLTSTAGRQNLQFARVFADYPSKASGKNAIANLRSVTERESPPAAISWSTRVVFAALALAAIICVSWVTILNRRLHHEIDQMRVQQAGIQQAETELRQQLAVLSTQLSDNAFGGGQKNVRPSGSDIVALALTPGLDRSTGGPRKLDISPATLLVQLQLYLEHDDYPIYNVSLETAEGAQLWKKNGLKGHPGRGAGIPVTLGIPASVLQAKDYLVRLTGVAASGKVEEVADYRFLVVRRFP